MVADRLGQSLVRSIDGLAEVARRLGNGELTARAEPTGPPELRSVASALNTLATRIRALLAAERESVADLSHRVRTPLTVLQIDAESLRNPDEATRMSENVDSLRRAVNDELPGHPVPVKVPAGDLAACLDALLGNVFAHTRRAPGSESTCVRFPTAVAS